MIEYVQTGRSLGSNIIVLSTLLDANVPISLTVGTDSPIPSLLKLFDIGDNKIKVNTVTADQLDFTLHHDQLLCDYAKFFSPYITHDKFKNQNKKPCIGIACDNNGFQSSYDSKEFPFNRYHAKSDWMQLICYLSEKYDIITFNQMQLTVEDKARLIYDYCDAVIGYEGGIMHLAHCLQVPAIVFYWPINEQGTESTEYLTDAKQIANSDVHGRCQQLHMDSKTWFVHDPKELVAMSYYQLNCKINELKQGQGNNIFLTDEIKVDFDRLLLYHKTNTNPENNGPYVGPYFTEFEKTFLKKYIVPQINENTNTTKPSLRA